MLTVGGIDVGGTKTLGVLVDADGTVLAESRVPTRHGDDGVITMLAEVVDDLRAVGGRVDAVGAGLPGLVDDAGTLRFAPNIADVSELAVAERLGAQLRVPLVVDNDANCAIWAEHEVGAARGVDDVVLITLGTGIGTGLVIGGQPYRGGFGLAGELGHTTVDPDGEACTCGRTGCWETVASGRSVALHARRAAERGEARSILAAAGGDPGDIRGEHVSAAARASDPEALAIFAELGRWTGIGLANHAAVMDPALILLGGGLVLEVDLYLEATRVAFADHLLAMGHRPLAPIEPTLLGERAGAIGAALLAARAVHPRT